MHPYFVIFRISLLFLFEKTMQIDDMIKITLYKNTIHGHTVRIAHKTEPYTFQSKHAILRKTRCCIQYNIQYKIANIVMFSIFVFSIAKTTQMN